MRFYKITISPPIEAPNRFEEFSFSSQTNGKDNYSALQLDLDIYQESYSQYSANGFIKINGIDLKGLGEIGNYNPKLVRGKPIEMCKIKIEVGMSKGLPYANPSQQGIILIGGIMQAFANWQGVNVSLDMIVAPAFAGSNDLNNITFVWKKNTELSDAVKLALETAYKPTKVTGSFRTGLKQSEDAPEQNFNLLSLSRKVNAVSRNIIKEPTYTGGLICVNDTGFYLTDNAITKTATKTIKFTDVIGNLTWLQIGTISAKVVMRGDLNVGDYISFEINIPINNTVNNFSQYRNNISFDGIFYVSKLHHIGSSRSPDGNGWVTTIEAIASGVGLYPT